ncbi:hypothetical protein BX666DRAFT_1837571, partial [Dichotomocladium elegans]
RYDRKWRWWHYLTILIFIFGALQALALITGYQILHNQAPSVRIALRQYPPIPYKHLDPTLRPLDKGAIVYHVTKEFGIATNTELGPTVTSLVAAQQRKTEANVRVVMPYYSFLKNKYPIEKVADLTIDIRDKKRRLIPIDFRVWRMNYIFTPIANVTDYPPQEYVPVYLIGPGNRRPFNQAFRARNPSQMEMPMIEGLSPEWHDQFFVKAASAFLAHQASAVDELSLFAPIGLSPHIDVVHLHGAATAYVAKHLHDKRVANQLGRKPPAVVYTMHDVVEELRYTHSVSSVIKFADIIEQQALHPYVRGHRVFMSSLGMDHANVVTIVGNETASEIVEGRVDFYLKEVVMDSVLRKAQEQRFIGIENGVDLDVLNPFTAAQLTTRNFAYPAFALDLIQRNGNPSQARVNKAMTTTWPLSGMPNDYVSTSKDRAKRFLVRRSFLTETDLKRPLAVYVGPLEESAMLEAAAAHFSARNTKFVIIAPRAPPSDLERYERLQETYAGDVVLTATPKQYRQWTVFCRAAADLAYQPDAAQGVMGEAWWFGTPVIISASRAEDNAHVIDRPLNTVSPSAAPAVVQRDIHIMRNKRTRIPTVTSGETYNAYVFDETDASLGLAIEDAVNDITRNNASKVLREEFALRMARAAYQLGWYRGETEGPVHDYGRVYKMAVASRPTVSLSRHEIDEEEALLRRL